MPRCPGRGAGEIPSRTPRILAIAGLVLCNATSVACSTHLAELPHQSFDSLVLGSGESSSEAGLEPATYAHAARNRSFNLLQPSVKRSFWEHYQKPLVPRFADDLTINAIDASVKSLLYAISDEAKLTLKLHGKFDKKVTLHHQGVTLTELLDDIASQVPISWELKGNRLEVWTDQPYLHSYPVNYLNIQRTVQSSLGLATQVGSINATQRPDHSIANSSKTQVENTSQHGFWSAFENDIKQAIAASTSTSNPGIVKSLDRFSVNPEAGILTVYAQPHVHQAIKKYLNILHSNTSRQVRIEATVVEVILSNEYQAGVDWQILSTGLNALQAFSGLPEVSRDSVARINAPNGLVSLVRQSSSGDLTATVNLLEQFGDVKILSRPRIIALNNQVSILKVVDNKVYFTTKVERSQSDTNELMKTETDIHTVPVGLVMNVTPQISENHTVMLNIRPSLSRIIGFVNDPNPELAQADVQNSIPEIQVREMETMLKVASGDLAIIGGLMQETRENRSTGIPGLSQLPLFKHLFGQHYKQSRQTELLVVLRPTVIDPGQQSDFGS